MGNADQSEKKEDIIRLLETRAAIEFQIADKTSLLRSLLNTIKAEADRLTIEEQKALAECELRIKELTLAFGETVGGSVYQSTYNSGRVTWNNEGLKGYAVAHPEIEQFKREGKPYVSIKRRKNNAS